MKVDGSICITCSNCDPLEGNCIKHGHDAMELRDGVRDCIDYKPFVWESSHA